MCQNCSGGASNCTVEEWSLKGDPKDYKIWGARNCFSVHLEIWASPEQFYDI